MEGNVINFVQQYREKAGLTQEMVALGVGVTRQTIIAIEKGNYAPSILLALKLAVYFNVSVETLFLIPSSSIKIKKKTYER